MRCNPTTPVDTAFETPLQQPQRRLALRATLLLAAPGLMSARQALGQDGPQLDVPYVPTPQVVVDRMIQLGNVDAKDVVYDLGCGDGRLVITAAQKGARGMGVDLNPARISEANANAKKAGVTNRVQFKVANLFETDVSPASVVTLYLLPEVNMKIRPQLWRQLKVGTRVVSHAFDMGDWAPEQTVRVDGKTIYAWTITQKQKSA
jgi:SAM-dependent methyltransferase